MPLALLLSACDEDPTTPTDMGSDAEIATPLLRAGPLRVHLAEDGATASLWIDGIPRLTEITPQIKIAGRWYSAQDWPSRSWTGDGAQAEGLFIASDGRPTLRFALRLTATELEVRLTLEGVARETPIEALMPLSAQLSGWSQARPAPPGPWRPLHTVAPRDDLQWLRGELGVARVGGDLARVDLYSGLQITTRGPEQILRRGDALRAPAVRFALGLPTQIPATQAAHIGWRSWAWQSAVSQGLVRSQARALAERTDEGLLLLDGLWYAAPGQPRVGPSFESLDALAESVAPNGLALTWPLHTTPDSALLLDHPAAALDHTERCPAPDCVRVDPRVPAARTHASRALLDLPIDALYLVDLPPAEQVGAAALRTLEAELADTLQSAVHHTDSRWPSDDPCLRAPHQAACVAYLTAGEPSAPPPLEPLGWALLDTPVGPRDLGPVRLNRPLNEARQAVALAWIAGGPRFIGDDLTALDAPRLALLDALFAAHLGPAAPMELPQDTPPERWRSALAHIELRWASTPRSFTAPSEGAWRDLLRPDQPTIEAGATLTVPAHDAVVLVPAIE